VDPRTDLLPLKGVRVIDFTWVVAGPVATRILADQGAEVIKIERKVPGLMGARRTGLQGNLNRDKLSLAINMSEPTGVELARRLVTKGDIVIDNFSARVMRQWGMGYQSLRSIKPDIICISMSGLGHTGPRKDYVSYGPTLQALSGYTMMMTDADGAPAGFGYSYADMAGGYTGALAALIAMWHRRRTGEGQFVDLSQFEAVCALVGPGLLDVCANRRAFEPPKYRSQEALAAPHGVFRCKVGARGADRWIAIAARSQLEWRKLTVAMGSPAWASNPKFQTLYLRMKNAAELEARVAECTAEREAEELMYALQEAGIPAGIVSDGEYLCLRDRQLKSRGYWPTVKIPNSGPTQLDGIPFNMSATPASVRSCAPEIGESANYVLGEILGLGAEERNALVSSGAIWP
jgi:crotonobetainyl-CoA:carnitine CoA-transferase CaiB-like acyl-CoA transferase